MKKMISAILASVMCVAAVPFTAFAEDLSVDWEKTNQNLESMKNGEYPIDFNGDGVINYQDAAAILKFYSDVMSNKIDKDGNEINGAKSDLDAETIKRIVDYGDIAVEIDGFSINALDASILLKFMKENGYIMYGDVNIDGNFDALDASIVLEYYAFKQASQSSLPFESDFDEELIGQVSFTGDINQDGAVDALDASEILSVYAENAVK